MLQSMQANATEHSTEHATELVSSAVLMYVGQVDNTFIALASEVLKETRLFILRFVRGCSTPSRRGGGWDGTLVGVVGVLTQLLHAHKPPRTVSLVPPLLLLLTLLPHILSLD